MTPPKSSGFGACIPELTILKICYKEHIIISVACRGDTRGPKNNTKGRKLSSEDEIYNQKTKNDGPQPIV